MELTGTKAKLEALRNAMCMGLEPVELPEPTKEELEQARAGSAIRRPLRQAAG